MSDQITVDLGERSYPIRLGTDELDGVGEFLRAQLSPTSCAVLSDENVAPLYAGTVVDSLQAAGFDSHLVQIPAGEEQKSIETFGRLCRRLVDLGLDRKSVLVALGGGVVGDLGGFVAAGYMRGIPYLQVPTTLLAQVDSSVGGKTAVNLPQGKNLVGAFYQPVGVYVDSSVLSTLADRDLRAGMVEVLKYGVIRDAQFFRWLEENLEAVLALEGEAVLHAVRRSCEIKAEVVAVDERESGLRAILNYGHTVGHAVEALSTYGRYRHGEAVAVGMEAAAALSTRHLDLSDEQAHRQHELLSRLQVPTRIENLSVEDVIEKMASDKKTVAGRLRFILARRLGEVEICADVPRPLVREALEACGAMTG